MKILTGYLFTLFISALTFTGGVLAADDKSVPMRPKSDSEERVIEVGDPFIRRNAIDVRLQTYWIEAQR